VEEEPLALFDDPVVARDVAVLDLLDLFAERAPTGELDRGAVAGADRLDQHLGEGAVAELGRDDALDPGLLDQERSPVGVDVLDVLLLWRISHSHGRSFR
jgi:hypothetical protein